MRYFIEGFEQRRLLELGLDAKDAIIIRWFVDFYHTDKMKKKTIIVDGKEEIFAWVYYKHIVDDLPILALERRAIARRFDKYIKCGLIEKYIDKSAGNMTYFKLVEQVYVSLLPIDHRMYPEVHSANIKSIHRTQESIGSVGGDADPSASENTNPYGTENPDIDSNTNINNNTNNSNTNIDNIDNNNISNTIVNNRKEKENIKEKEKTLYQKVCDAFNNNILKYSGKVGRYRVTPSFKALVNGRLNDGYTLEDILEVIDKMYIKWWPDPRQRPYLRPSTLFRPNNFQSYLNLELGPSDYGLVDEKTEKGYLKNKGWQDKWADEKDIDEFLGQPEKE